MEALLLDLNKLLRLPSVTGDEQVVAEFLIDRLTSIGLTVELQEVATRRHNIIARRISNVSPNKQAAKLLLCAHMDTVPAYSYPMPFLPKIKSGKVSGRGAIDAKGQIAALLSALELSKNDCIVAFTVDEEGEGRGSELLDLSPSEVASAVVLEPTNLMIGVCQAGFVDLEIEVEGKAQHPADNYEKENAILKAFELYNKIKQLDFLNCRHRYFEHPPWSNLGIIEGGVHPLVLPYSCRLRLELMVSPACSVEIAKVQLQELLGAQDNIKYKIIDEAAPFCLPEDAPIINYLKEAYKKVTGEQATLYGMPTWTDAENLYNKNIPTAIFGAGELKLAHSQEEAVDIKDLELLSNILSRLIDII